MTQPNHHPNRRILAGLTAVLVVPLTAVLTPTAAQAATGCTQTVTGNHNGVINVAKGQKLCLVRATQNAAVNVAPGGSLVVSHSMITGVTTLKKGFGSFRMCGSKTIGAITATGGRQAVIVGGSGRSGSATASCRANNIDGAVTLDANRAGVTLGRNQISGAVTASANRHLIISGNKIGGDLTCTTNKPRPTNAGVQNTVAGARSGQNCARSTF